MKLSKRFFFKVKYKLSSKLSPEEIRSKIKLYNATRSDYYATMERFLGKRYNSFVLDGSHNSNDYTFTMQCRRGVQLTSDLMITGHIQSAGKNSIVTVTAEYLWGLISYGIACSFFLVPLYFLIPVSFSCNNSCGTYYLIIALIILLLAFPPLSFGYNQRSTKNYLCTMFEAEIIN